MGKSLLIRSLMIGFISLMVGVGIFLPHTINADLNKESAVLNPSTLVHNGRLTICKLNPKDKHVIREISARLTAYTNTKDQTDDSPDVTASGFRLSTLKNGQGVVANNFLPFGTEVMIPSLFGDKVFTVQDRGNPKYFDGLYRFDVYIEGGEDGRNAAKIFGVRNAKIQIVAAS